MANVLKLKDGTVMVLGEKKRDGGKREVKIDTNAAKLTFKEGGARRFGSADKAERWAKGHNFNIVQSFSA